MMNFSSTHMETVGVEGLILQQTHIVTYTQQPQQVSRIFNTVQAPFSTLFSVHQPSPPRWLATVQGCVVEPGSYRAGANITPPRSAKQLWN